MDLHCAKCASTICEYGRLGLEEASTAVAMAVTGGWLSCINFFVFPQGQAQMGAAAAALPTPTLPLGLPTTMPVATATSTAVKGAASSGLSPSANLPDLVNLPPLPPIHPALLSCPVLKKWAPYLSLSLSLSLYPPPPPAPPSLCRSLSLSLSLSPTR